MRRILRFFLVVFLMGGLGIGYLYWENHTFGVTRYEVEQEGLPDAFDGFKIVLIADIQGQRFGKDNRSLAEGINRERGDMLVFCGDLIDDGVADSEQILAELLEQLEFPEHTFAVSGNHDLWTGRFETLRARWEDEYPIRFLENESISVLRGQDHVTVNGIADPETWDGKQAEEKVRSAAEMLPAADGYQILLFHRANMLDLFQDGPFDLVLSGHMHGGQVRIPFWGGLISPHGDWFPQYSGGRYEQNGHTYIVSRGVGNAVSVPRVFNRPELVVVTLKRGGA